MTESTHSRVRICILSLGYYPKHIGGAEVAIKEITDRLDPAQYEFHLIANRYDTTLPKEEQLGNVHVHRIGLTRSEPSMADLRRWPLRLNKLLYQFLAYRKAAALHRTEPFDALWAMMAHATGVPAGCFKARFPKVPYVLTLQEGDPPEHIERQMRIFGPFFSRTFARADTVQVISNFLGRWATRMGYPGQPILIPNGVNVAHFSQAVSEAERGAVRTALGLTATDTALVTTSRLVRKNGLDTVIDALPLLPPSVHFVVYGTGPEEATLRALAADRGVSKRVHFMGQCTHEEMPRLLKSCDIFIRPSRSEGMGISFLEAMAAGLPVIATREGGIADFLFDATRNPEHEPTGWAVDVDAPGQIAAAVKLITTNPHKVEPIVERAQEMVATQYDWDLVAHNMEREVFAPLFRS